MRTLPDIQNLPPTTPLEINRVGVKGVRFNLELKDKANGVQTCLASAELGVNLSPERKGAHMSRLVEILDAWRETIGYKSMRRLLAAMAEKLEASRAWARFEFAYLIRKRSPRLNSSAPMAYDCAITGFLDGDCLNFTAEVTVPVMTVCPCSKAISAEGAHSQRAEVRMKVGLAKFVWLEDFVAIAENSASSAVYPLLKREDEKFVTETAFSRPMFVEDVVRNVSAALTDREGCLWHRVEVESMESIHGHNAFAIIEAGRP